MPDEISEALMIRAAAAADLEFIRHAYPVSDEVITHKLDAHEIFVAERDGHPLAQLWLEYVWSVVPYLALLRVEAEHRRKGVGSSMLRHLEDYLRARGHEVLYSSSQADEPEPQAWHRRMGFVECGFIAGMNRGGVGEVFFRKELR